MLVSVIVPIFNVEKYIKNCVESLLVQSYKEIEYIFIDDSSQDDSINILKDTLLKYPEKSSQINIIKHPINKGLPSARNSGLKVAKGEYIFHCDSDDWIDPDMIESLVNKATLENADIVYCDWYLSFSKNERLMKQKQYNTPLDCIIAMLNGEIRFNVWNKLIKKSLYIDNNITFPDGYGMGEDMTIIKLFSCAHTVAYLPKAFYHYIQTNPNAFTKTFSDASYKALMHNTHDLVNYLENKFGKDKLFKEIHYFKLNMKLPFLISTKKEMYNLWRKSFNESNSYISSNSAFAFRTKLIQYAALKNQDWVIKFYNIFIIKFIYGIIYR